VRLFVAVWPPPEIVERLAGLPRPEHPRVRWTTPDQWHVTLVFLGEQPAERTDELADVLRRVAAGLDGPPEARLGPATELLSRSVLSVPVAGLDPPAAATAAAMTPPDPRRPPFRGHLTLARARGRDRLDRRLAGTPVEGSWLVRELCLVSSTPGPGGSRYATVFSAATADAG